MEKKFLWLIVWLLIRQDQPKPSSREITLTLSKKELYLPLEMESNDMSRISSIYKLISLEDLLYKKELISLHRKHIIFPPLSTNLKENLETIIDQIIVMTIEGLEKIETIDSQEEITEIIDSQEEITEIIDNQEEIIETTEITEITGYKE